MGSADDPPQARGSLYRLGRFCASHAWTVVLVWVVLLAAASLGSRAIGSTYSDDFSLPGSSAQHGAQLLKQHSPGSGGQGGELVFTVSSGSLSQHSSQIESSAQAVGALPHVLSVGDPLAAATTSKDGRTSYASVHFDVNPTTLGSSYVQSVDHAVAPARSAGVHVDYGGVLGQAARPENAHLTSELIGIGVAILVLLIGFGSVYAAGLPIFTAALGVGTGLGVLGMVAAATEFASVSPTLAVMIGLGVGIDYGLFLTTRHRQHVMDGMDPVESAGRTTATSGRAVLIAGITVVIAMLGLFASGIGFIGKLGAAASVAVAVAAAASVTLVPAMFGLAGRSIDRMRVRAPSAESDVRGAETAWHRYAVTVERRPWTFLLSGLAVLVIIAIPVLSMTIGHVDEGADPPSYTDARAYDAISKGFGVGANGPIAIVVQLPSGMSSSSALQLGTTLQKDLASAQGVASATTPQPTSDGKLLVANVIPTTGPQDAKTDALVGTLRDTTLPKALAGSKATGYVTGTLAGNLEFRDQVTARLPVIIAVVVAASFVLLLASFRSPLLALKAAIANLFSIGAAYGVVVAVFQWGWGGSLLGVHEKVPIESYVPMMMFAIVFGLSMDYEVFLLSRIRERWVATEDNGLSVADGMAVTAKVITCAALIMASVFFSFLLSGNVVIKMLALGLGVSVLLDASVIRLVIVPATMFLFGRTNWWLPGWLDRVLPHLEPEPEPEPHPAGVSRHTGRTS